MTARLSLFDRLYLAPCMWRLRRHFGPHTGPWLYQFVRWILLGKISKKHRRDMEVL